MKIAKAYINEVYAHTISCREIPRGVLGAQVELEYAEGMWDGLIKNVVFTNGIKTVTVMNAGGAVRLPYEVVDTVGATVRIGVCGVSQDGATVIPTLWTELQEVSDAVPTELDGAAEDTLPVWAQLQQMIGDLTELDTETKTSLVAAVNEMVARGLSAYDIAVNLGFQGTAAEWVASLQGEKGDPGEQGSQGIQGEVGPQGEQGEPGADGLSAYDYAVLGGYQGTEEEFAEMMAQGNAEIAIIPPWTGTLDDIHEAQRAGKICFSLLGADVMPMVLFDGSSIAVFSRFVDGLNKKLVLRETGWTIEHETYQKVSEITGESADEQIPTVKAVRDLAEKKLDAEKLPEAVENALAQAKESGEFDGPQGEPGPESVFVAIYGETTVDEVIAAVQAGKTCFAKQENTVYAMHSCSIGGKLARFLACHDSEYVAIQLTVNGWVEQSRTRSRTEVVNEGSTHSQFPTAKAVFDLNKPLLLDAESADAYLEDSSCGDAALAAIKAGRQILVKVPNADGGNHTAIYTPIMMYQLPNYQNQYLYLFFLRDEKQDLSALLGLPAGSVQMPTYGELKMLLSQEYNADPLGGGAA